MNNYVRDEMIYNEWKSGKTQYALGKQYNLTPTRIWQILTDAKRRLDNPDHICIYLSHKYPYTRKAVVTGAINPILRYLANKENSTFYKKPKATKEYFFSKFMGMDDELLSSLRGIGEEKMTFLKQVRNDRIAGLI